MEMDQDELGASSKDKVTVGNWKKKCKNKKNKHSCGTLFSKLEEADNLKALFGGKEPPPLTDKQSDKALEPCLAKYGGSKNDNDESDMRVHVCWVYNEVMLQLAIYEKKHHQGKKHQGKGKGKRAANEPQGESTSQGQLWLGGALLLFILLIAAIVAYFHFTRDKRETKGQAKGGSKAKGGVGSKAKGGGSKSGKPTLKSRLSKSGRKSGKKSAKSAKTRPSAGTKKSAKQHK